MAWNKLVIELQSENENPKSVSVLKEDLDLYITKGVSTEEGIKDILYVLYDMLNNPKEV